jgi:hypothetical protein
VPYFVNNPKHWRQRADEARAVGAILTDPEARESMLAVAEAYGCMAERVEKHPITKQPLPKID